MGKATRAAAAKATKTWKEMEIHFALLPEKETKNCFRFVEVDEEGDPVKQVHSADSNRRLPVRDGFTDDRDNGMGLSDNETWNGRNVGKWRMQVMSADRQRE